MTLKPVRFNEAMKGAYQHSTCRPALLEVNDGRYVNPGYQGLEFDEAAQVDHYDPQAAYNENAERYNVLWEKLRERLDVPKHLWPEPNVHNLINLGFLSGSLNASKRDLVVDDESILEFWEQNYRNICAHGLQVRMITDPFSVDPEEYGVIGKDGTRVLDPAEFIAHKLLGIYQTLNMIISEADENPAHRTEQGAYVELEDFSYAAFLRDIKHIVPDFPEIVEGRIFPFKKSVAIGEEALCEKFQSSGFRLTDENFTGSVFFVDDKLRDFVDRRLKPYVLEKVTDANTTILQDMATRMGRDNDMIETLDPHNHLEAIA